MNINKEEYDNLGKNEDEKGNYDKAIEYFSKAISIDKYYYKAYCNRGIAFRNKGNIKQAILDFNFALKINSNPIIIYNRGLAFAMKKEFNSALKDFYAIVEKEQNDQSLISDALFNIGNIYLLLKDYNNLIKIFTSLINTHPKISKYYYKRAKGYLSIEKYDKAIEDLNIAIEINPINEYFFDRGYCFFSTNQLEKAISDYIKIPKEFNNFFHVKRILGYSYALSGKMNLAYENFNEAINIEPNNDEIKEQIKKISSLIISETIKKQSKENEEYNNLTELFISSNSQATNLNEIPEGYGEFGLSLTNPIPTNGIRNNITYLDSLRTTKGHKIEYKRLGSTEIENIEKPIDIYKIFVKGNYITTIYISPYHQKNSNKAPQGFNLI